MATAAAQAARPLSPHLTIYKFRVNMITSVFFRGVFGFHVFDEELLHVMLAMRCGQ